MKKLLLLLSIPFVLDSCKKEDPIQPIDTSTTFSEVPEIKLEGVSATTVKEFRDPITFDIYYKDGDGDLGFYEADSASVYVTDTRAGITEKFFLQPLAPANTKIKIDGHLKVSLNSTFIINAGNQSEQVVYKVRLRDRAGHWSNEVSSVAITVTR